MTVTTEVTIKGAHRFCEQCGAAMREVLRHDYKWDRRTGQRSDRGERLWSCPHRQECRNPDICRGACICDSVMHDAVSLGRIHEESEAA